MAAMSLCLILWKMTICPVSVSRPRCSASSSRARATRALTVRKLAAARLIGLAQARHQGGDEVAVDFGIFSQATEERFAANEAQLAVPDGDHGGRPRQSVD